MFLGAPHKVARNAYLVMDSYSTHSAGIKKYLKDFKRLKLVDN
jgi:hypothetical protein